MSTYTHGKCFKQICIAKFRALGPTQKMKFLFKPRPRGASVDMDFDQDKIKCINHIKYKCKTANIRLIMKGDNLKIIDRSKQGLMKIMVSMKQINAHQVLS